MSQPGVQNRLTAIRKSRGVTAADLARRVGVTRQTVYAIEAGSYVPNTQVALKLARELEVAVEEIFALPADSGERQASLPTQVLSARPAVKGQPVRLCRTADQWVSVPSSASPYYLPEADGVISRLERKGAGADVAPFAAEELVRNRLILAGCDPATSLLASMVEKVAGVEILPAAASSKLALSWLKQGFVHIAGSHLEDPETGEFNLPYLRHDFPDDDFAVVSFARWEEGLVTAAENPKGISKVEHLAGKAVRIVNREPGSGSRALLDRLLKQAGLASEEVQGYQSEAFGHLAAAYAVVAGKADCCLATRAAAQAFGLHFVALKSERYDLVMRRQTLGLPPVQSFLDVLHRARLRRKLELMAGYDTRQTGTILA